MNHWTLFRKIIFWCHLSVGLTVGLVVLVIAASGIGLAFRPQVTAWAERGQTQVAVPPGITPLSLDTLSAKVMASVPQGSALTGLSLSSSPGSSVLFNLGKDGVAYVNPYTGEFLGRGALGVRDFFEWDEGIHRWFGFAGTARQTVQQIKGAVTLLFGFMVVAGFYLWWPRKWSWTAFKAVALPSFRPKGKARDWNWHNTIGFWCAPGLLLIMLTGLVMVYPWANDLLYRATGNVPPPHPAAQGSQPPSGSPESGNGREHSGKMKHHSKNKAGSLDSFLKAVEKQAPGWKSINLRLPQHGNPNVVVQVEEAASPRTFTRSTLTLDAATGQVVKWEPYESQNLGRKLRLWARYTHTGESGGFFGQVIAALAALGACLLVWTGFAMAWRRFTGRA